MKLLLEKCAKSVAIMSPCESHSSNGVIELVGQRSELLFLLLGLGVDNRGEVESEIPGLAPEVVLDVGPRLLQDQPLHRNDLLC